VQDIRIGDHIKINNRFFDDYDSQFPIVHISYFYDGFVSIKLSNGRIYESPIDLVKVLNIDF